MSKEQVPKQAPVQGQPGRRDGSFTVDWDIHVRAWQVYAALGHGDQSAQRIAERGGFGALEMIVMLAERNPWGICEPLTEYQLAKLRDLRARGAESLR